MNFLSFEYVQAIHRAGTIRGAAEALYVSPQALSEHLGKLEKELGAPLFRRTKPLSLTEAGERFLSCAQTCLEAKGRLEAELAAIAGQNDSHISIGVPTGMPPPMLLPFLSYFRHAHPELTVTITELSTRTGVLKEIPGHIDALFGEMRADSDRLQYYNVFSSSRFVVALHRELLRASLGWMAADGIEARVRAGEVLNLAEFQRCPFVLKRTGSIVRDNEDRLFQAADFVPRGIMETGDMELTVRMVLLKEAAVYFPEPVAKANFMLPTAFEQDSAILLCPVQAENERWDLSIGYDRYHRIPDGMVCLAEAAKVYYESVLGGESFGQ